MGTGQVNCLRKQISLRRNRIEYRFLTDITHNVQFSDMQRKIKTDLYSRIKRQSIEIKTEGTQVAIIINIFKEFKTIYIIHKYK